jgi:hypothetical protein
MTKSTFSGALVVLSALAATPAMAQEVIYNPGRCAQFYPNANCQNLGPNNPYTGDYQRRQTPHGLPYAVRSGVCASGVESYRGRDGRRHYCY